jgi:serine/threonine protein kinase
MKGQDMPQDRTQLIAGIYRTGKTLLTRDGLTICTASHTKTNETVELCLLELPSEEQPPAMRDYFQQLEQRRQIQSTRVRRVYDWGQQGKLVYIVTEPTRGVSLQHLLDTENIELERALELAQQIALGLTELHAQGIVGLDLRPCFITVDTTGIHEKVQLSDIGLRTLLHALHYTERTTRDDIAYLDPRYAPPEYLDHTTTGPGSDIYQVALLLFALITGRLPFVGRTADETAELQRHKPLPPMRQFKHNTPDVLQEILDHATRKELHNRFNNAAALIRALATVQQKEPVQASGPVMSLKQTPLQEAPSGSYTIEIHAIQGDVSQAPTMIGSLVQRSSTSKIAHQLPINGVYAYLRPAHPDPDANNQPAQRLAITQTSITLGRRDPKRDVHPDIDLSKLDPRMTISRQHARIRFEDQAFTIEDLKSRNHTRLGDTVLTPLQPVVLQHGDTIILGSVHLRFEVPGTE